MTDINSRIEELQWVLRQMRKVFDVAPFSNDFEFGDAEEMEGRIIGRILALENEAIAQEALSRVR